MEDYRTNANTAYNLNSIKSTIQDAERNGYNVTVNYIDEDTNKVLFEVNVDWENRNFFFPIIKEERGAGTMCSEIGCGSGGDVCSIF